jgi:hypothetical protein
MWSDDLLCYASLQLRWLGRLNVLLGSLTSECLSALLGLPIYPQPRCWKDSFDFLADLLELSIFPLRFTACFA